MGRRNFLRKCDGGARRPLSGARKLAAMDREVKEGKTVARRRLTAGPRVVKAQEKELIA
jgi:hypothetical protein